MGSDLDYNWNEYGVCINPIEHFIKLSDHNYYAIVKIAQIPAGFVMGIESKVGSSCSSSPVSIDSKKIFPAKGTALIAGWTRIFNDVKLCARHCQVHEPKRKQLEKLIYDEMQGQLQLF